MVRAGVSVLLATLVAGCSSSTRDAGAGSTTSTPASPTASEAAGLAYVAFGASWAYGAHCGMCETFVSYYATYLEEETGRQVELDNRTTNGGDTADLLRTLRSDDDARASVARADVVVIGDGLNDLDRTGTLEMVADDRCGAGGSECLRRMGPRWRRSFDAILDEVDALTSGRAVAVRLVGAQNVFLSDPSIVADYRLPAGFARGGGETLTRDLADAMQSAADRHDARFVDVWRSFNGPSHDRSWDENSPEAHQAVARALLDTGLAPLDLG